MLILLVGPNGAGKRTVATYLHQTHGFARLEMNHGIASDQDGNFVSSDQLLDFVTLHWSRRLVIVVDCGQESGFCAKQIEMVMACRKRPFAIVASVHGRSLLRFERCGLQTLQTLESFLEQDDKTLYVPATVECCTPQKTTHNVLTSPKSLWELMTEHSGMHIENSFATKEELFANLESANLTDPNRLRPNWDLYFMELCDLAAQRSNCMKRRVGCVVTKDRRVIATGYNGTPIGLQNCNEGGCKRCNEGVAKMGVDLELCICLHAEENALLEAGRERISQGGKSILYCNTCPCTQCARKIIQVGISEVVYSQSYGMDDVTTRLFDEAGVKLRHLCPLQTCI